MTIARECICRPNETNPGCIFHGEDGIAKAHTDTAEDAIRAMIAKPIPMLLICPSCHNRHIDGVDKATGTDWSKKLHKVHACQTCGHVWQPALVNTVGVQFLPGYKNDE